MKNSNKWVRDLIGVIESNSRLEPELKEAIVRASKRLQHALDVRDPKKARKYGNQIAKLLHRIQVPDSDFEE